MKPRPYVCRECGGEGCVPINGDKPIRRRWSYDEGYEAFNAETCPRCGGDGYEPETQEETQTNDQDNL